MAPEQATADPTLDHRADLYALGIIAYEMLAGAHPFGERTPQAFVVAHLSEKPRPIAVVRPETPRSVAKIVMQLLEKNASDRPQRAAEIRPLLLSTGTSSITLKGRTVAAIAVLAAVSVAAYIVWRPPAVPEGTNETLGVRPRTLAVIPFVNTGGVAADDYFSDGMTDELAHALSRIPGIRLAGRTSSYAFKGMSVPAQEIGRKLEVDAIVHGTVRRSGDRLRVTSQLESTRDGKVLWDSVFESKSADVFGVQDEFTHAIVAALAPTLSRRGLDEATGVRGTNDVEAYELYLKGRYHFLERGGENVSRSIGFFKQAIARDSMFARAHAALANAYTILDVYFPDPNDSATALTEASARRAVALDSTLPDAQIAMATAVERRMRFPEAERWYRSALGREPSNATARHFLGALLLGIGRNEESINELQRATQLDPMAKSAGSQLAYALVAARRYGEAIVEAHRVLAIDSVFMLGLFVLASAQTFGGQPDSALHTLERGLRLYPTAERWRALQVVAYATAGRWAEADGVRRELQKRPTATGDLERAYVDAVFGKREPVIRLLATERGKWRWYDAQGFGCNPMNDLLWPDPRFQAVAHELGIAPCPLAQEMKFPPR
jgi:serine/threonine-protein kinase